MVLLPEKGKMRHDLWLELTNSASPSGKPVSLMPQAAAERLLTSSLRYLLILHAVPSEASPTSFIVKHRRN